MDEGRQTPCCQFAGEDDLEHDPDVYQCEACPVMERIDRLRPENLEAWAQFQQVVTRFTHDCHAVAPVLSKLGEGQDVEDFMDRMARFAVLYDVFYPAKKPGDKHGA